MLGLFQISELFHPVNEFVTYYHVAIFSCTLVSKHDHILPTPTGSLAQAIESVAILLVNQTVGVPASSFEEFLSSVYIHVPIALWTTQKLADLECWRNDVA